VIAIADRKGATLNEKGLDIPRLTAHMARGGSLTDFEGGGPIFSGPNFLTIPCDVLVPAALGGVITANIAKRLQCKVSGVEGGGRE
jgi:glutamate dehydrogenase (NAD(P)+)